MSTPKKKALTEVAALYRDLDEELASQNFSCGSCGLCCHFDEMEHTLFTSGLEMDFLLQHLQKTDTSPVSAKPLRCPFQVEEKCTAHSGRILGCRLHHCQDSRGNELDEEAKLKLEELSNRYHARLKDIHQRYSYPWNYTPFLNGFPS